LELLSPQKINEEKSPPRLVVELHPTKPIYIKKSRANIEKRKLAYFRFVFKQWKFIVVVTNSAGATVLSHPLFTTMAMQSSVKLMENA
jgi:hypothetical protein